MRKILPLVIITIETILLTLTIYFYTLSLVNYAFANKYVSASHLENDLQSIFIIGTSTSIDITSAINSGYSEFNCRIAAEDTSFYRTGTLICSTPNIPDYVNSGDLFRDISNMLISTKFYRLVFEFSNEGVFTGLTVEEHLSPSL